MSSRRRPPTRAAVLALAAALPLLAAAGCGAGRHTTTDKEHQTPYVASADAGSIAVRGARLIVTTAGASAAPTSTPGTDTQGYLTLSVVNRGSQPDSLTNATVDGGAVTTTSGPSDLSVGGGHSLVFGDPATGSTGPALEIVGFSAPLRAGTFANVALTFQQAGTVTLKVPIEGGDDYSSNSTQTVPLTGSYPEPSTSTQP